jgi:hypothetical protein
LRLSLKTRLREIPSRLKAFSETLIPPPEAHPKAATEPPRSRSSPVSFTFESTGR